MAMMMIARAMVLMMTAMMDDNNWLSHSHLPLQQQANDSVKLNCLV